MSLLLTRPRAQGQRFADAFAARFGDEIPVIESPVIEIVPRDVAPDLDGIAGLIFTSSNAVDCFASIIADRRIPAFCIGGRTAEAARAIGLAAQEVGPDADALVRRLAARPPGGRLLHLRGAHARGQVAQRLSAAGQPCNEQVIYDQVSRPLSGPAKDLLAGTAPVLLPLFSPRSAALVSEAAREAAAPLALATMSRAVTEAWHGPAPALIGQAEQPEAAAMLDVLARLIDAAQHLEDEDRPS